MAGSLTDDGWRDLHTRIVGVRPVRDTSTPRSDVAGRCRWAKRCGRSWRA